ncbi:MAG: 50S ribosomal protein L28 [Firmicutes bacterium]|nr:50S ribosomal protein L28 [Bacillota bacterium]
MARCAICGKGPHAGKSIAHSHLTTNRRFLPNIKRVKAIVDGETKHIYVCTRCLRSGKVQRAV